MGWRGGSLFGTNPNCEPQTSEDDIILLMADGVHDNTNATILRLKEPNRLVFQHTVDPFRESGTHGDFSDRLANHIVDTDADLLAKHQRGRAIRPAENIPGKLDRVTLFIYRTRHEHTDIGLFDMLTVPAVEGLYSELAAHARSMSSPFKVQSLSPHSTECVTITVHSFTAANTPQISPDQPRNNRSVSLNSPNPTSPRPTPAHRLLCSLAAPRG